MLERDGDVLVDRYVRFLSGDDDSGFQELLAEEFMTMSVDSEAALSGSKWSLGGNPRSPT